MTVTLKPTMPSPSHTGAVAVPTPTPTPVFDCDDTQPYLTVLPDDTDSQPVVESPLRGESQPAPTPPIEACDFKCSQEVCF